MRDAPLTCPLGHTDHHITSVSDSLTATCATCETSVTLDRVIIGRSDWTWGEADA